MSDAEKPKVYKIDSGDPEIQAAYERARDTFRYFWRELTWERRRIIPGLDMAAVKAPFTGPKKKGVRASAPDTEHMWISDVDFDGETVSGTLMNDPNWITSVKSGDAVSVPLAGISDWMYVSLGDVYGGHTVQLTRSRMGKKELREHDEAWGLNFGDPGTVRLVSDGQLGSDGAPAGEHPMSQHMATALRDHLAQNPAAANDPDDNGWTLLHQMALSGSLEPVRVLLDGGADPNAKTPRGATPLHLARSLGWDAVADLLTSRGAK